MVASEPMAMQPAIARQNGRGVWLYNQLPATASEISSLQRRTPFFSDAGIRCRNASSIRIRTSRSDQLADSVIPCCYPASIQRASLKEQISAQRCCKCCAVIVRRVGIPCTLMTLTLSVYHAWGMLALQVFWSCLSALAISFLFRERLRPSRPPVFFLPGICEKKTAGRRFERRVTSELTSAQCPRASPSPQRKREHSPILFSQHDQHPLLWATWSRSVRVRTK